MLSTLLFTVIASELNEPARYIKWSWFQISVPNLIVIVLMVVVLILAIVVPFPKEKS